MTALRYWLILVSLPCPPDGIAASPAVHYRWCGLWDWDGGPRQSTELLGLDVALRSTQVDLWESARPALGGDLEFSSTTTRAVENAATSPRAGGSSRSIPVETEKELADGGQELTPLPQFWMRPTGVASSK